MGAYAMFNQSEVWLPKDQPPVRIVDMDPEWRLNAALLLERGANVSVVRYGWSELFSLSGLSEDTAMDLEGEMEHWQAQRERDPLGWVRSTSLYQALVRDLPADESDLAVVADRARHWSSCPGRAGATCECKVGPRADNEALAGIVAVVRDLHAQATKAEAERVERERRDETRRREREWMAANPGIDPDTGRPWNVDEDGIDHSERHAVNDHCHFDSCSACGGYHCGWCPDRDNDGGDDL